MQRKITTQSLTLPDEQKIVSSAAISSRILLGWPSIQYLNMYIPVLLKSIKHSNYFDSKEQCYSSEDQVRGNIQRIKQKDNIQALLNKFHDKACLPHDSVTPDIYLKANNDLQKIIASLKDFESNCPLIKPFLKLYEVLPSTKSCGDSHLFLNKNMLTNLNIQTQRLLQQLNSFSPLSYSSSHENPSLKPYSRIIIDALNFFNLFFTPQAIAVHEFSSDALILAEESWDNLFKTLTNTIYFRDLQAYASNLRPLISLYYSYLEERLKQTRATANLEQIKYTLLSQQFIHLEKKWHDQLFQQQIDALTLQQQVEEVLDHTSNESECKKALSKIAAICKYDEKLKSPETKKRPPAIMQITELSDVKKIPTEPPKSISITDKENWEEKKYSLNRHPVVITYLFNLEALKQLNDKSKILLDALQQSSFWRSHKKMYRERLIELIISLNNCFKIQNLSDDVLLERGNFCIRELMSGIQSPGLSDFESETDNNLGVLLQNFIFFYGRLVILTLHAVYVEQLNIQTSIGKLKIQMILLENKMNNKEKEPTLLMPEQKHLIKVNKPFKKALINIVSVILFAEDIQHSPQIIPALMVMLKHSYDALSKENQGISKKIKMTEKEKKLELCQQPVREFHTDLQPTEYKIKAMEPLSLSSLEFLCKYAKILQEQYNSYAPEDSWILKFGGFTDDLGGLGNRRDKYIQFVDKTKKNLVAFIKIFESSSIDIENANKVLKNLIDDITPGKAQGDSLSNVFYKIYQDEITIKKTTDSQLLGWEALKKIHVNSQSVLREIKSWDTVYYGYLSEIPLLKGALQLFHEQFLSKEIRRDNEDQPTLAINKILTCFMQMLFRYSDAILPEYRIFKLIPFVIQYNEYLKEAIEQLNIAINKKKLYKQSLTDFIRDLSESKILNLSQHRVLLQNIVEAKINKESICKIALQNITKEKCQHHPSMANVFDLAHSALIDDEKKHTLPALKSKTKQGITFFSQNELIKSHVLYHWDFLLPLREETAFLSEELSKSSHVDILFLANLLNNFQKCLEARRCIEEVNYSLNEIVVYISDSFIHRDFNDEIKWALQRWLTCYSQMITEFLQYLHKEENNLDLDCHALTAKIDDLNQQQSMSKLHSQSMFKTMIVHAVEEEHGKEKPYEQTLIAIADQIFKLDKNTISITMFPVIMNLLRSVYSMFDETRQILEKPTYRMQ